MLDNTFAIRYKKHIVQYYFCEKKQKEIAEELGISIKTVDSRIRLGKKAVEEKADDIIDVDFVEK